jgi:CspA family cold shock protein
MIGTIKKLVSDRGFGFIAAEDGQDHFFHLSDLNVAFEDVHEGDQVQFDPEQSARGPRAKQVRLLTT